MNKILDFLKSTFSSEGVVPEEEYQGALVTFFAMVFVFVVILVTIAKILW